MRTLLTAAALTAAVVAPALAKTAPTFYAQPGNSAVVIQEGKVVGQDPDASVRLQLRRDAYSKDHA